MTEQLVPTNGYCLTALCGQPARYAILRQDGWWWPKCVDCCARERGYDNWMLPVYAVRDYDAVVASVPVGVR